VRTSQPDRDLEWALIGSWDHQYRDDHLGVIELFVDRTYTERRTPHSRLDVVTYQIGGQECRGPWHAYSDGKEEQLPYLHMRMHHVSFPCMGLFVPLTVPLVRLYDLIMQGRVKMYIASVNTTTITFTTGEVWVKQTEPASLTDYYRR